MMLIADYRSPKVLKPSKQTLGFSSVYGIDGIGACLEFCLCDCCGAAHPMVRAA
jgi:hypothetical protein